MNLWILPQASSSSTFDATRLDIVNKPGGHCFDCRDHSIDLTVLIDNSIQIGPADAFYPCRDLHQQSVLRISFFFCDRVGQVFAEGDHGVFREVVGELGSGGIELLSYKQRVGDGVVHLVEISSAMSAMASVLGLRSAGVFFEDGLPIGAGFLD